MARKISEICGITPLLFLLISCGQPIQIQPDTLEEGWIGKPYSRTLEVEGATGKVTWTLSGELPAGLEFDSFGPEIHGLPSREGEFGISITARDSSFPPKSTTRNYTLTIGKSDDTFVVQDFTDDAIRTACNQADALGGGVVYLPAGTYQFDETVHVSDNITLLGATPLKNVVDRKDDPSRNHPYWDGAATECRTTDKQLELFRADGDNVTFAYLRIAGNLDHETNEMQGKGIVFRMMEKGRAYRCEISRFTFGIRLVNAESVTIERCYIRDHTTSGYGYGVCVQGGGMHNGGSTAVIRESEFKGSRCNIASNSPETRFAVIGCRFRDDADITRSSIDAHPQGGENLQYIVMDNVFENTIPTTLRTGTGVFVRNTFRESCSNFNVPLIRGRIPEHNHVLEPGANLNNLYISGNRNDSDNSLFGFVEYDFPTGRREVARSVFLQGWGLNVNTTPGTVRPMVGEVYLAKVGKNRPVRKIRAGEVYELHVYVADPQGWTNLREVEVRFSHADSGVRIHRTGQVFEKNGSGWNNVTGRGMGQLVAPRTRRVYRSGSHRLHFRIQVRFPLGTDSTAPLKMVATTRDGNGNESVAWADPYGVLVR